MDYSEWLKDQEVIIEITITVNGEQILSHEELNSAIDLNYTIDEVTAALGNAQRNLIPRALQEQFNFENEIQND